jgi:dihydroorotase-like cyclic amidohydrolase
VNTIGTDHVPRKRETKGGGIWKATAGFPGVATMLPVMMHEGYHKRGVAIERIAAVTSANAARLYNIPGKGQLTVGFDADFAIVDPELERTVDAAELRSFSDYSPYEGERLKGWPVKTMLRGRVIAEDGKIVVPDQEAAYGRYVGRKPARR